jgi:N utilization substance protein A
VQSIIRELRGEKIDIVEWNDDPSTFVVNALSPAKVSRVSILDEEQRIMEVVVEDKQLSLAIGKKGQNVRLAAKLTGWRIDIKSEEEKRREVEAQFGALELGDGEAPAEGSIAQAVAEGDVDPSSEAAAAATIDEPTPETAADTEETLAKASAEAESQE